MSGYLEEYGAGDEVREHLIRNSILLIVGLAVSLGLGYYLLKPIHQISTARHFLGLLRSKDYQGAYAAWDCAASKTCKEYTYDKFLEDWGPKSMGADRAILRITDTETCGQGEIVTVNAAEGRVERLWLEKGSEALGFSPAPVCPGKGPWGIMLHRTLGRLRGVFY